jgi:hypothetical protein
MLKKRLFFLVNIFPLLLVVGIFAENAFSCECKRTVAVYGVSHTLNNFEQNITTWLSQKLGNDCVIVVPLAQADKPEYVLSVHYEQAENSYLPQVNDPNSFAPPFVMEGTFRKSTLAMGLFYTEGHKTSGTYFAMEAHIGIIGFRGSIVNSFTTRTIRMSLDEHKVLMGQKLADIIPFSDFLEKREQIPEKSILEPEKKELLPGETIKIKMADFKDKWGESIKGNVHLRFTIKAEKGRVQDHEQAPFFTEKEYVFAHQRDFHLKHPHTIGYKAPVLKEGCYEDFEDTITIYNSCNILDFIRISPLKETECKKEIAKLTFKIKCPRGRVTVRRSEHTVYTDQAKFENAQGEMTGYRKRQFRDEKLAVFSGKIKLQASYPQGGNFCDLYMIENPRLLNSHFLFTNIFRSEQKETTFDESRIGFPGTPELKPKTTQPIIITYNNDKRQKVIDFTLPGYTAIFTWTVKDEKHVVHKDGTEDNYSNSYKEAEYFTIERKGLPGSYMDNAVISKNFIYGENIKTVLINEVTQGNGIKKGVKFKKFEWNIFLN